LLGEGVGDDGPHALVLGFELGRSMMVLHAWMRALLLIRNAGYSARSVASAAWMSGSL